MGKRRLSPNKQNLATIALVFIGALTFSVAPQLIANQSGRGLFASSMGFVHGAAVSFVAHANATKALTALKLKNSTQQARKATNQKEN